LYDSRKTTAPRLETCDYLALARCVYRAVASKKHYAQEIVQLQQRLAFTWVLKSIGKSVGKTLRPGL
jgi:hypothetical protein